MMKIGILTFYNTTNYGALLQMYALYHTLREAGYDTSIIRYYCDAVEKRENLKVCNARTIKQILRALILKHPNAKKQKQFRMFENKYFKYSDVYYTDKNISGIGDEYDEVIVGSDQVWNLNLTGEDMSFFLRNVEKIKKVSYAASFGSERLEKSVLEKIAPCLTQFDAISVRERSGVNIVRECCGRESDFVLDPTFLLKSAEWDMLADQSKQNEKPYILLYLIQNKKQTINYAKQIAKINGWNIKYINISPYHVSGVCNIRSAPPTAFLQMIRDASLVITGSYHGLALSINYSKPVYYELNKGEKNYNTRISSLISTLKMEKCQLDYERLDVPQLDYEVVQGIVSEMREKSKEILFSMCKGI